MDPLNYKRRLKEITKNFSEGDNEIISNEATRLINKYRNPFIMAMTVFCEDEFTAQACEILEHDITYLDILDDAFRQAVEQRVTLEYAINIDRQLF